MPDLDPVDPSRKITVIYGDISLLQLPEGAIVNPSNTGLILGSGVGEQIGRRAGPMFQQQLHILRSGMRNNQLDLGQVIESEPGHINAKYVIHASVVGRKNATQEILTTAILNTFDLAERLELKALAFPALGVGISKYTLDEFLELFWRIANEELPRSESLEVVVLCLYNEDEFEKTYEYITSHEDFIDDGVEVEIVRGTVWDNL